MRKYPTFRTTELTYGKPSPKIKGKSFKDITGMKFNHLTVLEEFPYRYNDGKVMWIVQCDCEAKTIFAVTGKAVRTGSTRSCGCIQVESVAKRNLKHGYSYRGNRSRLIGIHNDMIRRCYNPKRKHYESYGGRGITVCDEWRDKENGTANFIKWAFANGFYEQSKKTSKGELLSIERKDVNGPYCPENCIWIPLKEQGRNKQSSTTFNIARILVSGGDLIDRFDLDKNFIGSKVHNGWTSNSVIYCAMNGIKMSHVGKVKNNILVTTSGFRKSIPDYANLNPWSDNIMERKLAEMYLSKDDIEWLLKIKKIRNQ